MTCIAIAYPDPDIPTQQAVGMAIAVLNKMADDTENQENAENKTAFALSGTPKLIILYDEFHRYPPV